jgi:hypothetical protein
VTYFPVWENGDWEVGREGVDVSTNSDDSVFERGVVLHSDLLFLGRKAKEGKSKKEKKLKQFIIQL